MIKELGPGNSKYLAHEHTVRYLRQVSWFPKLTNRRKWEAWMATGGQDMRDAAREQARKILAQYHPHYLSEEQEQEIQRIARTAQEQAI